MYVPRHFQEADPERMRALMRRNDFALLIAGRDDGAPEAAHLPFLLEEGGPHGTLVAHMARANPLWKLFQPGKQVLVTFQGPHGYISPSWYAEPGSVPTWNYAAVHAYGVPKIVADAARSRAILDTLVHTYESGFEKPWRTADHEAIVNKMLPGIVAFEIPIDRIEAKWKLSQNKSAADRAGAIAALERAGTRDLARLMAEEGG